MLQFDTLLVQNIVVLFALKEAVMSLRKQLWPVVKQDVRGPDLVWRESKVLDTGVVFWIPAQIDVCPVLIHKETVSVNICCYQTVQ